MSTKSFEDLLDEFHEKHEVEYVLQVVVDGEVIAKFTSPLNADDVAGYAWAADRVVEQNINDEEAGRLESEAEEQLQNALDEKAE